MSELPTRIGWMIGGMILNVAGAVGATWALFAITMSGFTVSQTTLSNQMIALQGSLENVRSITDKQASEARGDLAREIGNLASIIRDLNTDIRGLNTDLGKRLEENSTRLASLNSTLSGMDKRLTDTIARQDAPKTCRDKGAALYSKWSRAQPALSIPRCLKLSLGTDLTNGPPWTCKSSAGPLCSLMCTPQGRLKASRYRADWGSPVPLLNRG